MFGIIVPGIDDEVVDVIGGIEEGGVVEYIAILAEGLVLEHGYGVDGGEAIAVGIIGGVEF